MDSICVISLDIKQIANIPCHISRACNYLIVVNESTAGQISVVSDELQGRPGITPLTGFQGVDGTHVVETPARDKAPRRGVRARHNPARAQRYSVHLRTIQRTDTCNKNKISVLALLINYSGDAWQLRTMYHGVMYSTLITWYYQRAWQYYNININTILWPASRPKEI